MKIALVHDRIVNFGGAEKVFKDIFDITKKKYPNVEIQIFTSFWDIKNQKYFPNVRINYIFETNNSKIAHIIDYRNLMPIFPIIQKYLSKKISKFNPDKIIISSFAIAKNIDLPTDIEKIIYLHSPMQYIWEMEKEYINKFKGFKKTLYKLTSKLLKKRDLKYSQTYNNAKIIYNSNYTFQSANKIYGWQKNLIARPQIDKIFINKPISEKVFDYFVFVGRIVKFAKELDKIIALFNQTKDNLLIIGDGPDKPYLQSIAGNNIIFLDYISNKKKLADTLSKSRGFINLTKESFGIATAEALSLGVPVFGYSQGGTAELIGLDNTSNQDIIQTEMGILVNKKNMETLLTGFEIFKITHFNRKYIKNNFLKKYKSFDFISRMYRII